MDARKGSRVRNVVWLVAWVAVGTVWFSGCRRHSVDEAALEGQIEAVGQGIARGTDVNMRDEDGRTALMLAAFNGHTALAELLQTTAQGE